MSISRYGAGIGLGLLVFLAPVLAQEKGPEKVTSVEGITEYRLDNGLRVLLFPDPSRPKVTVNLTVLVGSRHEGYGEAGMAHLLEHMLFKGTETHKNIPEMMKERGASFNGSTWVDRTNYYETLPADGDNLQFALELEADRMVNCPIRQEDLATEFSVVRNEFESGENNPSSILNQRMEAVAYEWHNYGKSTIGNRADIERVPVDNLRAFYKRYYQPDNAVLIVAGNFDEKKALELISKTFGKLPKPDRKLSETYTEEPAQDGERGVTLRRVGDVGVVGAAYHVPASSHPEFPAVQVLEQILGDEPSGRLYKGLVVPGKATSVTSSTSLFKDPGLLEVFAEVRSKDQGELEKVRDELVAITENVDTTPITTEEVERAKTQFSKRRELAAADPNQLAIALSEWAGQGDWRLYFLNRDRMEKVTPEQVKEVATKYLVPSNRTVGVYVPTDQPERTPIPAAEVASKQVEGYKGREGSSGGELLDTNPLALESRIKRLDPIEGVEVAVLPKDTRGDLVQVVLRLRFGNETNLRGYDDAASFLGQLMMRGTKNLSRQQIQDAIDKNFAQMMVQTCTGSLTANIQTKRANLPAVLDLLRQVLREPSFPSDEFETMKAERIARIEQSKTEPQVLASNRAQRLSSKYPPEDVRYVPTLDEELERTRAVTLDKVKQLYNDFLGSENGQLVLVGDFEPSEVVPLFQPILADWKAKEPYARIPNPFQSGLEGTRERIVTPDKANATYFAALPLQMKDTDPDYAAMLLGNSVLGGGALSSRIADRLRQKDGLSYGAGSMFNAPSQDDDATLGVFAIYNPMNVDKVLTGVDEELAKLLDKGVTQAELDKARAGYLKQREVQRSNDRALAGQIANQLYLDRTMQFEADLEAAIKKLTVEDVNAALKKHIDPSKLIIINAGDFKTDGSK